MCTALPRILSICLYQGMKDHGVFTHDWKFLVELLLLLFSVTDDYLLLLAAVVYSRIEIFQRLQ